MQNLENFSENFLGTRAMACSIAGQWLINFEVFYDDGILIANNQQTGVDYSAANDRYTACSMI